LFQKVLVANRGEIAVRVINACRSLGMKTVAVYSDADSEAMHVHLADEARRIGPPEPSKSYLNIDRLVEAAFETDCEAIHPGYGFLSENADFARTCESRGIEFVGPTSETLAVTGNKLRAKEVASRSGVPVIPGSTGVLQDVAEAIRAARDVGYPVLIKAVYGGGGRGIRKAHDSEQLRFEFRRANSEAVAAFGRPGLYVEKLIRPARHIEVQILANGDGETKHLGERECSIQRRHQKLIEVTPSPVLDDDSRKRITGYGVAVAQGVHYRNAGTVEFLRTEEDKFYFNEVNARVQVEHPITEAVTGVDIVKEQFQIASDHRFSFRKVNAKGAAIECRINAENPDEDFAPSAGVVERLRIPTGPGVRVDTALYEGYRVSEYYDSLVAKLIAWGNNFTEARERIEGALAEFHIEGIRTTIPFHRGLIEQPEFRQWSLGTDLLDRKDVIQRIGRSVETRRRRAVKDGVVVAAAMIAKGIHEIRPVPLSAERRTTPFLRQSEPEGRFYDAS
jgi:acetyl-CoA/propionyl-CoA carboxylase